MKITAMTTMMLMAATMAQGANPTPERNVTVCAEIGAHSLEVANARTLASRMFAAIGVTIDWRSGLSGCPSQAIGITLSEKTPANREPGALAYALPYEGADIGVFYDRIVQGRERFLVIHLLAHVLVHEITHILQAIARHSDRGIMKPRYSREDYDAMVHKPLAFTDEDVRLIHLGLAARARTMLVINTAPVTVALR